MFDLSNSFNCEVTSTFDLQIFGFVFFNLENRNIYYKNFEQTCHLLTLLNEKKKVH